MMMMILMIMIFNIHPASSGIPVEAGFFYFKITFYFIPLSLWERCRVLATEREQTYKNY